MASSRRTYDTDNITLRTVFAKNPDNTNVPALRSLTADGLGGAYWAIPSSLGGIPAYNQIITSAGSYTADLSFNKFRLFAGQNIGMSDGPAGSNQTTLYGKSFSQFDVSGNNTLQAFTGGVVTANVRFAAQGGLQITADPGTNTLFFNGPTVVTNVSTGIYGFAQVKVTPTTSTITSSIQNFGGNYITASSPSTILNLLGYNDIQLSTNVTTNSVFFTISTFTSEGYLAMSNTSYSAYPSSISTTNALLTSSFISSTAYFQSTNQANLSAVYSTIDGLAMSTGSQFLLLQGLINARATIVQLNSEIATVNTNIQSTSIGLGTLGYISTPGGGGDVYDYQIASTLKESPYFSTVAIGYQAGYTNQDISGVAIGGYAGTSFQGKSAIAIGNSAGSNKQGSYSIAIGENAASLNQAVAALAIGIQAGYNTQGPGTIAIGSGAGAYYQNSGAISMGSGAGSSNQGDNALAVGFFAGQENQGSAAVAVGPGAGQSNQGFLSIAMGSGAANFNQNNTALAIGYFAGYQSQSSCTVALGAGAGYNQQGSYSVAIGYNAGYETQVPSSIVLSALASTVNAPNPGFYVAPLRDLTETQTHAIVYDTNAFEAGITQSMALSNLNVSSVMETTSNLKVNMAALWSTLYTLYPACFS